MANKIKDSLKEALKKIKNTPNIESKSNEEIYNLLKTEICKSANISEEQWKEISSKNKIRVDVENMSLEDVSLDKSIRKLAHKIKQDEQVKQESSENDPKRKKIKFTINMDAAFKNKVVNMSKIEGIEAVKQEIISQAASQGLSSEMLERPCKTVSNANSKQQINLPDGTKFIDALAEITYDDIMGKDPFNKQQDEPDKKPVYEEEPGVGGLMNKVLGKNDTKVTSKDKDTTYQGPSR